MLLDGMVKRTAIDRRQRGARVAFIVLASLTLSLLPLRALCEPGHQTTHQETSDLCCTSIDDSALVKSVAPDLSGGPDTAPLFMVLVSALVLYGFALRRLRMAGAPPPSRSYYARSSRIQR
ncbi:MAG: hypothetical protein WBO23_01380 [Burkholderiales bacterium]